MKMFKNASRVLAIVLICVMVLLCIVFLWPQPAPEYSVTAAGKESFQAVPVMAVTQPLPDKLNLDPRKVALGDTLFHDVRLSGNGTVSCASCHVLAEGGDDNRSHSNGINGAQGGINAPTVFNSGFNFVQFWDGRAATLESQIDGPVNNPVEMASNWPQVINKLQQDSRYREAFSELYKDGISTDNIKDAIATFERSLVTPDSRFDRYLKGEQTALSRAEKNGYLLFQGYGCIACHQGINLGGNMFERMGMMADYFGDRGNITKADQGRFNVTQREADRYYFRVPSLRNVDRTAPYFHDGSATDLSEAVRVMAKYQLGRPMPEEDLRDIVLFLKSLNGKYGGKDL